MDKRGFPSGDPQQDAELLRVWWTEEMTKCGISGTVSVQHQPYSSPPALPTTGLDRLMEVVTRSVRVAEVNIFAAAVPGASWPIDSLVVTMSNGWITTVAFHALLRVHLTMGDVVITKSMRWIGEKIDVGGPGAQALKARRDILKVCKADLSFHYDPPLRGFHASKKTLEMKTASVSLTSTSTGTEAVIRTTVRDEAAFVGRKYSLGLDRAIRIFDALETLK